MLNKFIRPRVGELELAENATLQAIQGFELAGEPRRAIESGDMRGDLDANDRLLVDSKFPPGRDAQGGSRSHPRQRLTQPASRFRSGCLQLQKLLASLSQASAAAGQEATFVERLPEPDQGPVL